MKFLKIISLIAALLLSATAVHAAPDSKGTDFWLAFPGQLSSGQLTLFIAGDTSTSGNVSIPGLAFSQNFIVTPGQVTVVNLPVNAQLTTIDGIEAKGIHVTAENEVTVYGLNRASATTDAYLGLPTDILGLEYLALGFGNVNIVNGTEFAVAATADNTTVTITPSVTTGARTAGTPYNIVLNQGQVYQLRDTNPAPDDLSGTIITSDKKIAVFGGHECANIPDGNTLACDHVVEALPPTETWGKSFVTIPLATRENGDTFRFLASVNGTHLTVNGTVVATLNRGQFHQQIINGPATITSDQPILVAQYSNGCTFDSSCGPTDGDPFMMLIPPFEQFLGQYTVSTPDAQGNPSPQFPANFVNVVAPNTALGTITIDGTAINDIPASNKTILAIGSSGFTGAQISLSQGSHTLSGSLPFGAFLYGFGFFDSYGYPGGLSLAPVARVSHVALTPKEAFNQIGTQHCVTANVTDQNDQILVGVRVDFNVTGANQTAGFSNTNSDGNAEFCYTGQHAGQDTITAAVGDISDTASKSWVVEGNNPPTAISPSPPDVTTPEDTPKLITLKGSDPENNTLTFIIPARSTHGSLTQTCGANSASKKTKTKKPKKPKKGKDGGTAAVIPVVVECNITYTPDPNYNGPDSFTFKVNDGTVDSAPATVNITVTPVADAIQIDDESVIFESKTASNPGFFSPGIAVGFTVSNPDNRDSITLDVLSLRAQNKPKNCGANIADSDVIVFAPPTFSEVVPLFQNAGEIKAAEIGGDAMKIATLQGCSITLVVEFTFQQHNVQTQFSGSACIDSDTLELTSPCPISVASASRRSRALNGATTNTAAKMAPPRVR
jgi:hypothetical protein